MALSNRALDLNVRLFDFNVTNRTLVYANTRTTRLHATIEIALTTAIDIFTTSII